MFPEYTFQYEYIGSMYANVYKTELLQVKLLSVFTFVALFICSMGLLGLSLLTTQRRTREIGLRKINGARISEIVIMLNWDLVKWIFISFVLAIPLAYIAMNKWLENFAYKITLGWWIFVLAGLTALCIALITVSVQSWKSANRNPVEALRYE
jgi:putative ABC transport system permease protein